MKRGGTAVKKTPRAVSKKSRSELQETLHQRNVELEALHADLVRRNRELSTLLSSSRPLLRSKCTEELLDNILVGASSIVPSDAGVLFLINEKKKTIELGSFYNIEKLSKGSLPSATRQMRLAFDDLNFPVKDDWIRSLGSLDTVTDLLNGERSYSFDNFPSGEVTGGMTVLLRGTEGPLGYFTLIRLREEFSDEDGQFLTAFSNEAAVVLENLRIYEALVRNEKEAHSRKRQADIGEMAGQIAHEIRNPLQKILTGVEFLRDYTDNQNRTVIEIITKGVSSINNIVSKMVEFGRPATLTLRPCEVRDVVEEALSDCHDSISISHITVIKKFPAMPEIILDPSRFKLAVRNLLENSIEAMPDGGRLSLSVNKRSTEPDHAGLMSDEMITRNIIELRISDTGVGISEEGMEKIFTPFYTTKVKGSGLGMAMAKKIIESHKGEITVNSRVGSGTEVIITLQT